MFLFIQEHWLPSYNATILENDLQSYDFSTTSADMFEKPEDKLLDKGPIWHGTALGWLKSIDKYIMKRLQIKIFFVF